MTFGAEGTVRLPEKLETTGASQHGNVLGTDFCPTESLMGAAIYPGATAIGGQSLMANGETGTSEHTLYLGGPAVVRIGTTYRVPYSCGAAQHLTGEQTLTFFPDGRIFRLDKVTSSDSPLPATNMTCGCANMSTPDFYFTLFYAFASDAMIVDAMNRATQQTDQTEVCAQWNDLTIGLRWLDASTTRITPNNAPSFVHDMMFGNNAPFPVVSDALHKSTMMITSGSPHPSCGDVLAQIPQPALTVNGKSISVDDGGVYSVADDSSTFTISATKVVPPFAVSLKLGGHAKITSNVAHPDGWYMVQVEPDLGVTLVWFAAGLAASETITVDQL
jgi:hypothetical protein